MDEYMSAPENPFPLLLSVILYHPMEKIIISAIVKELGMIETKNNSSPDKQLLVDRINELINSDLQKLVSILYRMDVDEDKLKLLLTNNPGTDAGIIIADLMIEREAQKLESRKETRSNPEISDEEKW